MVPRLLHHIWLGPVPVPVEWANAWASLHPGWDQRIWREEDLAALPMTNRKLYTDLLRAGIWPAAADVARLEILGSLGGVYVDIDSRPLVSLERAPFMEASVFAGYEPTPSLPGRVANGTIGAEPGADAIRTAIRLVGEMEVTEPAWDTIGAPALTAALMLHRRCCDVRVLPQRTFYRTDAKGRVVPGGGISYSEHFWASTFNRYPKRVVVLVPRRAGIPERDAIWKWCKRIWEQQGWPVYEGHDDGPGLFNASAARNRAAELADTEGRWDVAVFADADTIPWDWKAVRQAVEDARRTSRFIRPANAYYMLDAEATRAFMETGLRPRPPGARRMGTVFYGGIHVVPRNLWEEAGGYDERFVGWGGEDAAFQYACQAVGGYRALSGEVFHLFHPMQQRDPSTPQFQANRDLERRYVEASRNPVRMRALLGEPRRR